MATTFSEADDHVLHPHSQRRWVQKSAKCIPCDAKYTSIEMKMSGASYNANNMKADEKPNVEGLDANFLICSKCKVLASLFNQLHKGWC